MEKYAESGTGGIPRRAFNDPRALASLGSSNLSTQFGGGQSGIGISRNNDFVAQAARGKFSNSDWFTQGGTPTTRAAINSGVNEMNRIARDGASFAQEVDRNLQVGGRQFATAEGIRTMRQTLSNAQNARQQLQSSVYAAASAAGRTTGDVAAAHNNAVASLNGEQRAGAITNYGKYAGAVVGAMDKSRGRLDKGIAKLERQIASSESKFYGQIRAATRGLGNTPDGDPFD